MKKSLLAFLILVLFSSLAYGQVTLTIDGNTVTKGNVVITTGEIVPPSCIPQTEYQQAPCPSGYTGSITQSRTSTCPGPVWSAWAQVSSTCVSINPGQPGSETNPIPLIQPLPAIDGYGYEKHYESGEYTIPKGGTVWFKIDPSLISGLATPNRFRLNAVNYDPYQINVSCKVYSVDKANPTVKTLLATLGIGQVGYYFWSHTASKYYLAECTEMGVETQLISIYWTLF
jgi:hypothetical protein